MKKKLTQVLALMLTAIMIGSFVGCGSRPKERKLRISRSYSYGSVTQYIMQEKGILEKHMPENVAVEWLQLSSSSEIRDAVVSGQVDIASVALTTYITAYENSFPLTLLSYSVSTPVNIYSNDPEITAIDEFPDTAKIAVISKGGYVSMSFLAYCKETLGDATMYDNLLTTIPEADAVASMQTSRDFNGAVLQFPAMRKAEEIEHVVLLADLTEVIEEYGIGSVFFTHSDYYEENPDIVEAFMEAQEEALQFIKDNPEETAQMLSEPFGIESDAILEILQKMPPHKEVVGYDKQAQLMYEAGILEKEPTKFADLPNYENIPK